MRTIAAMLLLFTTALLACADEDLAVVRLPDGAEFACEIADDQMAHAIGLSRHQSLAAERGMLFVYPYDSYLSFWMPPEMQFDLDMIFLDSEKRIIYIAASVKPCPDRSGWDCPSYGPEDQLGRYVIELVSGAAAQHGLRIGDTLTIEYPPGYEEPLTER